MTPISAAPRVNLTDWIASAATGVFSGLIEWQPWEITGKAEAIIRRSIGGLGGYQIQDGIAVHARSTVEAGAVVKSPAIIGPDCFVAAGAYLRGGVFLESGCVVGPGCEIKSSFLLGGARAAHQCFVGDSILGAGVNLESGVKIANRRNERPGKTIRIRLGGALIDAGVACFGALVGDGARIGANAVIAPGALIAPGAVVPRLALVDQSG